MVRKTLKRCQKDGDARERWKERRIEWYGAKVWRERMMVIDGSSGSASREGLWAADLVLWWGTHVGKEASNPVFQEWGRRANVGVREDNINLKSDWFVWLITAVVCMTNGKLHGASGGKQQLSFIGLGIWCVFVVSLRTLCTLNNLFFKILSKPLNNYLTLTALIPVKKFQWNPQVTIKSNFMRGSASKLERHINMLSFSQLTQRHLVECIQTHSDFPLSSVWKPITGSIRHSEKDKLFLRLYIFLVFTITASTRKLIMLKANWHPPLKWGEVFMLGTPLWVTLQPDTLVPGCWYLAKNNKQASLTGRRDAYVETH